MATVSPYPNNRKENLSIELISGVQREKSCSVKRQSQNSIQVKRKNRRQIRQQRRIMVFLSTLMSLALVCGFLLGRVSVGLADFFDNRRIADENQKNTDQTTTLPSAVLDIGLSQTEAGSQWNLILINAKNPLPEDFTVPKLTQLKDGHAIDSRVYPDLQSMMDDARAAGLAPLICSSFRTWEKQEELYDNKVQSLLEQGLSQEKAKAQASEWVAYPGTSEHQAGLAVDIVDTAYQRLDKEQENTAVQKWLMEHCAEYGFILRYPTEKSEITGIGYEPWHYRYVGKEVAQSIMEQGICLEEYFMQ